MVTHYLLDSIFDDIFPAFCTCSLHFVLVIYGTFIMFNDFYLWIYCSTCEVSLLITSIRMTYFFFLFTLAQLCTYGDIYNTDQLAARHGHHEMAQNVLCSLAYKSLNFASRWCIEVSVQSAQKAWHKGIKSWRLRTVSKMRIKLVYCANPKIKLYYSSRYFAKYAGDTAMKTQI